MLWVMIVGARRHGRWTMGDHPRCGARDEGEFRRLMQYSDGGFGAAGKVSRRTGVKAICCVKQKYRLWYFDWARIAFRDARLFDTAECGTLRGTARLARVGGSDAGDVLLVVATCDPRIDVRGRGDAQSYHGYSFRAWWASCVEGMRRRPLDRDVADRAPRFMMGTRGHFLTLKYLGVGWPSRSSPLSAPALRRSPSAPRLGVRAPMRGLLDVLRDTMHSRRGRRGRPGSNERPEKPAQTFVKAQNRPRNAPAAV